MLPTPLLPLLPPHPDGNSWILSKRQTVGSYKTAFLFIRRHLYRVILCARLLASVMLDTSHARCPSPTYEAPDSVTFFLSIPLDSDLPFGFVKPDLCWHANRQWSHVIFTLVTTFLRSECDCDRRELPRRPLRRSRRTPPPLISISCEHVCQFAFQSPESLPVSGGSSPPACLAR